jgi:hypothetical protein
MRLRHFPPAPGQDNRHVRNQGSVSNTSPSKAASVRSHGKAGPKSQEVERLKAEKKADIERRCQLLDPPIRPALLPFMDAYEAAILIGRPLNEPAWSLLRSRLLAQRAEAESKEQAYIAAKQATDLADEDRRRYDEQRKAEHAANEQLMRELGSPARHKLKAFADEYIASIWDEGLSVSLSTSARFAAGVLTHVKKRFDESIKAEDRMLASRSIVLPPNSDIHEVRQLHLDDMKRVYEESVRPHTERFGKDIFLCSVCEASAKHFSFDAVIQHFAAKHTSDLSRGNVVVHWKARWPAEWPFQTFEDSLWSQTMTGHPSETLHVDHGQEDSGATLTRRWKSPTPVSNRTSSAAGHAERPQNLFEKHRDEVTEACLHALALTDGIRGLPDSVRLYVVIDVVNRSFTAAYSNLTPTISLFIDCVKHRPELRALRDFNHIQCRLCATQNAQYVANIPEDYYLLDLLDHFHRAHIQHGEGRPLPAHEYHHDVRPDWRRDMICLPNAQIIRNLGQAPGMTSSKLQLIAGSFPGLFEYQLVQPQFREEMPRYPAPHDHPWTGERPYQSAQPYVPARMSYDYGQVPDSEDRHVHGAGRVSGFVADIPRDVIFREPRPNSGSSSKRETIRSRHSIYSDASCLSRNYGYPTAPEITRERHPQSRDRMPMATYESQVAAHEATHGLPFRPLRPYEEEPAHNGFRHVSTVPLSSPERFSRMPQDNDAAGDKPMNDVDNFLNSLSPVHQSRGPDSLPMSRRDSLRSHTLHDEDRGSTGQGKRSHRATPNNTLRLGPGSLCAPSPPSLRQSPIATVRDYSTSAFEATDMRPGPPQLSSPPLSRSVPVAEYNSDVSTSPHWWAEAGSGERFPVQRPPDRPMEVGEHRFRPETALVSFEDRVVDRMALSPSNVHARSVHDHAARYVKVMATDGRTWIEEVRQPVYIDHHEAYAARSTYDRNEMIEPRTRYYTRRSDDDEMRPSERDGHAWRTGPHAEFSDLHYPERNNPGRY